MNERIIRSQAKFVGAFGGCQAPDRFLPESVNIFSDSDADARHFGLQECLINRLHRIRNAGQ